MDSEKIMPYDQTAAVCAACCLCAGEIYVGQVYYAADCGPVCTDCLPDYARSYFFHILRTARPGGVGHDA